MPSIQGEPTHFGATISQTGVSQQILPKNPLRRYLFIQNVGQSAVWIRFGSDPAVASQPCIRIDAGQCWNPDPAFCPTTAVQAIGSAGGALAGLWSN